MPNRFELTFVSEDRLVQNQDLYARLELITPETEPFTATQLAKAQPRSRLQSRLGQVAVTLLKFFVGSREPQIVTKHDRDGNAHYSVYDPIDRSHQTFHSEEAVRAWLDGRYYR